MLKNHVLHSNFVLAEGNAVHMLLQGIKIKLSDEALGEAFRENHYLFPSPPAEFQFSMDDLFLPCLCQSSGACLWVGYPTTVKSSNHHLAAVTIGQFLLFQ